MSEFVSRNFLLECLVIQFRKVLGILEREVSWREASFPQSLVGFDLVRFLTSSFWFSEGALDFRCCVYPPPPSSALVHLACLPVALPSRDLWSPIFVVPTDLCFVQGGCGILAS